MGTILAPNLRVGHHVLFRYYPTLRPQNSGTSAPALNELHLDPMPITGTLLCTATLPRSKETSQPHRLPRS